MDNEKIEEGKKIGYYNALVNAWIMTRMEHDKTLLVLSTGAIGVLLTLLNNNKHIDCPEITLFILALISFIVAIAILLFIFKRNSNHIVKLITKNTSTDKILDMFDILVYIFFILGIMFSIAIAIYSAIQNKGK